jgi:hypothetical protein
MYQVCKSLHYFCKLISFFFLLDSYTSIIILLGAATEMRNWNAAKVFSYKEIKAATNNFKEVIGRGSFGSVYLGKLPDGKLVALKVRFDKSQLGADSFINEVHYLTFIFPYIGFMKKK